MSTSKIGMISYRNLGRAPICMCNDMCDILWKQLAVWAKARTAIIKSKTVLLIAIPANSSVAHRPSRVLICSNDRNGSCQKLHPLPPSILTRCEPIRPLSIIYRGSSTSVSQACRRVGCYYMLYSIILHWNNHMPKTYERPSSLIPICWKYNIILSTRTAKTLRAVFTTWAPPND